MNILAIRLLLLEDCLFLVRSLDKVSHDKLWVPTKLILGPGMSEAFGDQQKINVDRSRQGIPVKPGRLDPEASITIFLAVYLARKCLSRVATLQIITGWSTCNSIKDIMIIHNSNLM
jgi:hypothetical protein